MTTVAVFENVDETIEIDYSLFSVYKNIRILRSLNSRK